VSVIVPTHNRCALLGKTIRSILEQTYTLIELIVVSDGSTDDTPAVIASFSDPRLIFLQRPPSGRPSVPRNQGIAAASGELIALCDDDDLWRPDKLARQVRLLVSNPAIGLCYTNTATLRNGEIANPRRLGPGECVKNFSELILRNYIANSSVVARKAVFDKVGVFDEDPSLSPFDDYEMWLRIAYYFPIAYLDEPLVEYRVHDSNIVAGFAERELIVIRVLRRVMQKVPGYRMAFALSILARRVKHLLSAMRNHSYKVR